MARLLTAFGTLEAPTREAESEMETETPPAPLAGPLPICSRPPVIPGYTTVGTSTWTMPTRTSTPPQGAMTLGTLATLGSILH